MISPRERRLVVNPTAAREVEDAVAWYNQQSAGLGLEFLRAITAVVSAVRRAPASYPRVRGDTRRALVRRFPYGVFFRETDDTIVVLAVVDSRRDPQVWQSRG